MQTNTLSCPYKVYFQFFFFFFFFLLVDKQITHARVFFLTKQINTRVIIFPHADKQTSYDNILPANKQTNSSFQGGLTEMESGVGVGGTGSGLFVDRTAYHYMCQDVTSLKTMLLRLRRVLHAAETINPFDANLRVSAGMVLPVACGPHAALGEFKGGPRGQQSVLCQPGGRRLAIAPKSSHRTFTRILSLQFPQN